MRFLVADFKPIANRWVWGRCLRKLKEPQVSVTATMTTLWAATTRHHHTENHSGKLSDTYQDLPRGRETLGAKKALVQAQAKTMRAKWLDLQRSAVKHWDPEKALRPAHIWLAMETAGQHCLMSNLAYIKFSHILLYISFCTKCLECTLHNNIMEILWWCNTRLPVQRRKGVSCCSEYQVPPQEP